VHGVLADDERAVILAGGEVGHGGETFRWGTVGIFRVTGGKIAERWVIPHDQHAFETTDKSSRCESHASNVAMTP